MRALVIGTGAAGNKAAIGLFEQQIISEEDLVLVNSTLRDIPEEYRGYGIQLSLEQEGCGKERDIAKEISLKALKSGRLNVKNMIKPEHQKIIIITSIEGGTGSGSSTIIAKYCKQVIGLPVEVIGFKGFEDDTRGLQNTVEWFQDLEEDYGIQVICNQKFLKAAGGNRLKAEKLANEELVNRVKLSLGTVIRDAGQNIDPADIFKISNTTGYTTSEYLEFDEKIKSIEQFNDIIKVMLDDTKSLENESPNATRLGVIINMNENSQNYIDYSYSVIKERMGKHIYEIFPHIQYDRSQPEFIGLIISGMKMPVEEVKAVYNKYKEESDALNNEDNFFDEIRSLRGNAKDNKFNMLKAQTNTVNENDFFNSFSNTSNDKKINNQKQNNKDKISTSEY